MRTPIRHPGRTRLLSPVMAAALAASLLGPLGAVAPVAASTARPAATTAATPAPAAPGPVTGTPCSPGCDLYATTGTLTLPDAASVPIWGYSLSSTPGSATLPGPLLEVTAGTSVAITLHNVDLPTATALMIAGQPGVPDTTGVTAGNTRTYSFPATGAGALQPGTYLYEAGLTFDGPRQVAMGLHGALVVRPAGAPLQAYANPNTTFTDEAALVLSEVDPAFNAAPATFDMTAFAPKYWLINGKGYPNTDTIGTAAGSTVLLRYVNAGLQTHSMSLLGLHQTIIATDGQPAANQSRVVAQTVPPGGTLDTLVSVPAAAPTGTQYAVFEAAMHMDNNGVPRTSGVIDFGGMLTFLAVSSGGTSGGTGPVTSNVSLLPNPSDGSAAVALSAKVTSTGSTVSAAEYFIDSIGANGGGTAMTGAFGSPTATVSASLSTAQLLALSSGNHTIYVHGQDANGWGAVASAVLNLDKGGPAISNLGLTPSADNGTADVALQATASDVATGNQNVTAAEYAIDGGTATPISVALPATVVSLSATILATTVNGLSQGNHTVAVRAKDSLGNWGVPGTTTLKVDKTGPTVPATGIGSPTAIPNPNNGTLGVQIGTGGGFYVRIDATVTDPLSGGINSNIAAAEYSFDTVGANGTGGAMVPTDGSYNSPSEAAYAAVDMIHIAPLTAGTHTIYVHAKDAAGNWGPTSTTTFVIDKTPPTVSSITRTGASPTNTGSVQFTVTFSENVTGVTAGNFALASTGLTGTRAITSVTGSGTTWTVTATTGTGSGTLGLNLTSPTNIKDVAGNAMTAAGLPLVGPTYTVDRTAPTFTSSTINPTSIVQGTATVTMAVNGSADTGGSLLANAGEYWFDTASITPGTGTAFTGTTGIAVTTGTLTVGSHTLRVRIRDNAGNWSSVHTATLTVTNPPLNAPTVSLAFAGSVRGGNGTQAQRTTTLTITLSNSNAVALTGAGLTDNLPQPAAGTFTVVASSNNCGGTTSTANTNRRLLLGGGTIPASGSCTVTATVRISTGATNGPYTLTNTIPVGGVNSTNAGSNLAAASAVLTVNP